MWRIRFLVILILLVGGLAFGAVVVYAGWWWNAQIDLEGVKFRTIWTVPDDPNGANYYGADITVKIPNEAHARVIKEAPNEEVEITRSKAQRCLENGIEVRVAIEVEPEEGAVGTQVKLTVATLEGGQVLGEETGKVGKKVKLDVVVPTDGKVC